MENILDIIIKISLVIFLSTIIGIEREIRHKVADLRTHILVGVGSALIVLTSFHIFDMYHTINPQVDPTRMITGIIQGIGFLCAGTIIRAGEDVLGLTSASTLWIVSCIGIAVASGLYAGAIIVTLVTVFVLIIVRIIEIKISEKISSH